MASTLSLIVIDLLKIQICAGGGVEAIVNAMKSHLNVAEIQQNACWALAYLSHQNVENQHQISAAGGVEAIAVAMKRHVNVSGVQQTACLALDNLNANNEINRAILPISSRLD